MNVFTAVSALLLIAGTIAAYILHAITDDDEPDPFVQTYCIWSCWCWWISFWMGVLGCPA